MSQPIQYLLLLTAFNIVTIASGGISFRSVAINIILSGIGAHYMVLS